MRRRAVILVLLAACEHPSGPAKPPGDPPCLKVAHHMLDLATNDPEIDAAKKFVDMVRERCEQDLWTTHAQECMIAMKTMTDSTKCEEMLTIEQRDRLVKAIDELFPKQPG